MIKGQGWTLIAQVSNADEEHWSKGVSGWWQKVIATQATDPSENKDMISPAIWLVSGNELMITRSDDPHTALLQTTDDCLGGQTFRNKIDTDHDIDFNYIHCKSSCSVRYGGMYTATKGFAQANNNECSQIGFRCRKTRAHPNSWAVMMIGAGGGDECSEVDKGIGIRRLKPANGNVKWRMDFGDKAKGSPTKVYSLNLWVR